MIQPQITTWGPNITKLISIFQNSNIQQNRCFQGLCQIWRRTVQLHLIASLMDHPGCGGSHGQHVGGQERLPEGLVRPHL